MHKAAVRKRWWHPRALKCVACALGCVVAFSNPQKLAGAAPPCVASPTPSEHNEFLNGVRLYYRLAGLTGGTPVIFLHGGPGYNSYTFAHTAGKQLETRLSMVYLDQRGS